VGGIGASRADLKRYVRDAASTYSHEVGSAKMAEDTMSVADADLKLHAGSRIFESATRQYRPTTHVEHHGTVCNRGWTSSSGDRLS
jgi:hypothetical protein